jgi:prepilin-type N-terminal cleavage/methylation domain-containing protein
METHIIMVTRHTARKYSAKAFTLIELLVVIAIIAILAAILFPVFGVVREQARQSSTMSNLHAVYVGARLFAEDEGHYPATLFPFAETPLAAGSIPANRPALGCTPSGGGCSPATSDTPIVPFTSAIGAYTTTVATSPERGFLYHEQIKDATAFTCPDNVNKKPTDVTIAYWPLNSPISIAAGGTASNPVPVTWIPGIDRDVPAGSYSGTAKLFYVMDSMDIGPMLNPDGSINYVPGTTTPRYELHYSPDWTHNFGVVADVDASGNPYVTQLKYANPPADRTILTYVTQHVDTAKSSKVMILLLNGTARKIDAKVAGMQLPLAYQP